MTMPPEPDAARIAVAREAMLALLRRHIRSERVIAAMASVPREHFVLPEDRARAYADCALPIAAGQTISQPLMVALMLQAAGIQQNERVLEVGTGSGYEAAVISRLATEVLTVERLGPLAAHARATLAVPAYGNVRVYDAGVMLGCPDMAPFDAVVVAAAAPHVPRALLDQLAPAGRLVIPVGTRQGQQLIRARRTPAGVTVECLGACVFVPLVGRDGWPDTPDERASRRLKV